jgi:hypothetical protein
MDSWIQEQRHIVARTMGTTGRPNIRSKIRHFPSQIVDRTNLTRIAFSVLHKTPEQEEAEDLLRGGLRIPRRPIWSESQSVLISRVRDPICAPQCPSRCLSRSNSVVRVSYWLFLSGFWKSNDLMDVEFLSMCDARWLMILPTMFPVSSFIDSTALSKSEILVL